MGKEEEVLFNLLRGMHAIIPRLKLFWSELKDE